jgi:pyruvate,orthophosphate dikinase
MKVLLGGKGANLADMTSIGLPVPPGLTITTDTCAAYYRNGQRLPHGLMNEVQRNINNLEKETGKKFGDNHNPLLVSVRSGAAVSMPGMMDTILNLGLTDLAVVGLANSTKNARLPPPHQHVRRRRHGCRSPPLRRRVQQDQAEVQRDC